VNPRILVAGIGNIFMADDAFGCEVARRLAQRSLPDNVQVVDFGIRSLDLTYAMLDRFDAVILVDAVPRGEAPGTLYVIEPRQTAAANVTLDAHGMDPVKVLQAVSSMGGRIDHVLLVGCEPMPRDLEADWEESLSPPVQAAIEPAVELVESLITKLRDTNRIGGVHHEHVHTGSCT
jgi:hydrogenase maturation protease